MGRPNAALPNFYHTAATRLISKAQRLAYPDVLDYFGSKSKLKRNIPGLVTQMNLFRDNAGVIRVKSKFRDSNKWPILLPKRSKITTAIIKDSHERLGHVGIYAVLRDMEREFWVTNRFATVKSVIANCITCIVKNIKQFASCQS